MKICFIAAGPIQWASSRYRAYWVAEALREMGHDATAVQYPQPNEAAELPDSDVYIWQKVANLEFIKAHPARHYWDLCDPSWWWQPKECEQIAQYMDGLVFSTQALRDDYKQWFHSQGGYTVGNIDTTHVIPDRFKLSHYHTQRQHTAVSPVRFIWYGIAANRVALWAAKANLERLVANGHKIELTIFDDRPDVPFQFSDAFPIYHTQWTLESEVDIIAAHDVALLPPYPGAWGKMKSDNKARSANMCGIPVWDGIDYMDGLGLMYVRFRHEYGRECAEVAEHHDDVKQSAQEWLKVLGV